MKKSDRSEIIEKIIQMYGTGKSELIYETPFQLLISVILSAQTTDKQVNKITPPFFLKVREPKDIEDFSVEEIQEYFKYVNYFRNKSRFIKETGTILAEEQNGIIPNDLKLLMTFPGVGVKTGKVVLSVLYDMPYVGVDTHIHRIMNRIGIVKTKTPDETDKQIDILFDDEIKVRMHHPLVLFGRYTCIARKPKCESCPLQKKCTYFQAHFGEKGLLK